MEGISNRFLILSDLDATLLNKKSEISKKTVKYIRKIVKKGHIFCLATGRPLQGMIRFAKTLNINCPIITDNGANIYFPDKNMEAKTFAISLDDFKGLLKEIDDIVVCGCAGTYKTTIVQNPNLLPYWMIHEHPDYKLLEGKILDIIDGETYLPSVSVSDKDKMEEALSHYPNISYRLWGKYENGYNYELFSKDASKGKALKYLKELYNIADENTIAFGDQLNDISMIEEAHYGCVMVNAVAELKSSDKIITKFDNNHDGVIKEIKRIINNN